MSETRMQTVIVERAFDAPAVFDQLQSAEEAVAWCLEQHNVRFVRSYLSFDARSMVCIYDAPDADAVRETQRQGRLPLVRVWSAQLLGTTGRHEAEPGLTTVVVEREFPEPMSRERIDETLMHASGCLATNRAAFLESRLSLDGRRMLCVFEAPDAEAVRRANRQMGLPLTRAWAATAHPR